MVFNWFRRQYSDNQSPESEVVPGEQPDEEDASRVKEVESVASDAPGPAAEDYLSWAKAAYKNIQEKQKAAQGTAPATEEPAPEPIEAVEPAPAPIEPVEPAPAPATEVVEPAPAPAPIEPVEPAPAPIEAVEPAPAPIEAVETPAETTPFWMKAEAERQARIERLKETAIEEPEPESLITDSPASIPFDISEIPDFNFDEGFLWSAEILAAQGRRPDQVSLEEITWLKKLRRGLDRTRRNLLNQLRAIVGQGPLNQEAVMEIEALLLQADVGVEATDYIIQELQKRLKQDVLPPEQAIAFLKEILRDLLDKPCKDPETGKTPYSFAFAPEKDTLNIWLITGVNGAGKTTTIGKIAHLAQKSDYNCLIAAADTFRAAAVEQLKVWGERSQVEVIANPGKNTDPAAVVFDSIVAAESRQVELLIVDTAGRLQNKKNLMDELGKIRKIIDKKAPNAKVESLLVLDATLGQNGLRQAEVFSEVAGLSGVVLTKLDGTAKGGVALAVVKQLGLPIRFIGVGEGIEDLRPFSSYEFVEALLSD